MITLPEAAKNIPVPRTTLNEYFRQLKQGFLTGFNFENPKQKKMEDLIAHNKNYAKFFKKRKLMD